MKKYIFYFSTGYVGGTTEEEVTSENIGIKEGISKEEKEKLLDEYYNDWISNFDSGWYEKQ